jgi:photosystem II stability/assembly factor-like uncharacterized protein
MTRISTAMAGAALLLAAVSCGGGSTPGSGGASTSTSPADVSAPTTVVAPASSTTAPAASTSATAAPTTDTAPPTTTAAPTTAPAVPTTGTGTSAPWVDATANLAGLPSECGNMYYVVADPAADRVIAGVAKQGLWVNDAGTDQWTQLGTGPGSDDVTNRAAAIVFDPDVPERFWESGHYGDAGAFVTEDGGATFDRLGDIEHLDGISVDVTDPDRQTLLAGAHERADLYRSTDGGDTWTNIGPGLPAGVGFANQPLVIDAQTFLLGTNNGDASGIFRSTDGGTSWIRVSDGGVFGAPVVSADGSISWTLDRRAGLVRSTDGGATWTVVSSEGLASYQLVELPDGRLASVNATNVIVSEDRGATWQPVGSPFPTAGAYGLTYSAPRNAFYINQWDCGDVVPPGSVQRLDLPPAG